ncbi:hypothetical protein [Nonomuraea sp. GTA35]|uniref:hypothetical protein n=1 Tax=Nonomuraea sp. GTA35 TaxID=1676746 RepID=UPI0035C0C024
MAVPAILIGSYEGQIAPVVPLLLEDLDMTLTTYGAVSGAAAVAGATASILGGRLTDIAVLHRGERQLGARGIAGSAPGGDARSPSRRGNSSALAVHHEPHA